MFIAEGRGNRGCPACAPHAGAQSARNPTGRTECGTAESAAGFGWPHGDGCRLDGRFTYLNPAAERLLGYHASELIAMSSAGEILLPARENA
jgi:PAS domain-containing protein